jgi:hypothetical protein
MPRVEGAAAGLVAASIKAWLAARPVYRFKDDIPRLVFKPTLKDIAVEGDKRPVAHPAERRGLRLAGRTDAGGGGAVWFWVLQKREEPERLESAQA